MNALLNHDRSITAAARLRAAIAHATGRVCRVEPLESRVLFAAGDLDLTFGGTGKVTADFFSRNDFGQAIAVQSDNKVLVAGWAATGTTRGNDVAVARFNADGTLDTTFGTGGKVTTHLGSTSDTAYAIAVQSDGRIVVAGNGRGVGTGQDFAVVRYNANGTLDGTFGAGGIARTDLGGLQTDQATAMTLTHDGRIVVVGSTIIAGNQQFAAACYTSSGLLDSSFGNGAGFVVHAFTNGAGQAKAVTARPDGTLILAGSLYDFSKIGSDFAAVRLFADGTMDGDFGNGGWATATMGDVTESAAAVLVQSSGHILLVGEFTLNDKQNIALTRLTASGLLDESFGGAGTGYVVTDFAGGVNWTTGALLQPDGQIVVSANATVSGPYRMAVARYTPNGALDGTFGAGGTGTLTVAFDGATESFAEGGIALDNQNRLVVGGHISRGTAFDMAAMRLTNPMANIAPTAHAGGAYLVNAGGSVALNGGGSSDVDGSLVAHEWDFDYDGSTFDVDATGAAPTFSAAGATGPAVRTVALRVTDNSGETNVATATITINAVPTAHAGGAYLLNAGGSIVLDGSGSSDVDGSVVSYAWDFDYDGSSFTIDATGVAPTFTAPETSGGTTRTIALRVTDDRGATSALATALVTINAAPLANAGGAYTVVAGSSIQLDGSGSSDIDGSVVKYEWDLSYDGATFDVDATGTTAAFAAPAGSGGTTRTVALRCTDNHGATRIATATVTITVPPQPDGTAMLVDDPSAPGRKMLSVKGTAGADDMKFKEKKGAVEVRLGNVSLGEFSGMTRIVVYGGAGNDAIDAMGLTVPVALFGGAGDDYLVGGDGHDILVGGDGDDVISGSFGNDVIVGGAGRDKLFSHMGNDLLVAGALTFEADLVSMTAILSEWTRTDRTLGQRATSLTNGGGYNGGVKLGGGNIVDDNAIDSLFGTVGADWLITGAGDTVKRVG